MANKRVFDEVHGATINGVTLGGCTGITVNQYYQTQVDDMVAGYGGTSAVGGADAISEGGQRIDVSITTRDITDMVSLLNATPGFASVFYGHESGAATWCKTTLGKEGVTDDSVLVMHTARLSFSRDNYAEMTVDGTMRMASADDHDWSDALKYEDGQAAPTILYPARLWKISNVYLATGPVEILHPMDFSLNLVPDLFVDWDGADKGVTAVDIGGFRLTGTLTCRDASESGELTYSNITKVLETALDDLEIDVDGVNDQAAQTLTILNVKFRGANKSGSTGYSVVTMDWAAQFRTAAGAGKTLAEMIVFGAQS